MKKEVVKKNVKSDASVKLTNYWYVENEEVLFGLSTKNSQKIVKKVPLIEVIIDWLNEETNELIFLNKPWYELVD